MRLGSTPREKSMATRPAMIEVLPEPAPASTNRERSSSRRMSIFISSSHDGADLDPAAQTTGTVVVNDANKGRQHGDISLCPWISTGPITAGA